MHQVHEEEALPVEGNRTNKVLCLLWYRVLIVRENTQIADSGAILRGQRIVLGCVLLLLFLHFMT
jgi:hypothetical protein